MAPSPWGPNNSAVSDADPRPPPGPNLAQMDLQAKFFEAYASAHAKLSELGSKFEPAGGITL